MNKEAETSATVAATDAYLMLKTQHENVWKKVASDLQLAKAASDAAGERLAGRQNDALEGDEPIQQASAGGGSAQDDGRQAMARRERRQRRATSFVDTVTSLSGGDNCTVFQRMNEAGDMLRISTTVRNAGRLPGRWHVPPRRQSGWNAQPRRRRPASRANVRGPRLCSRCLVSSPPTTPILDAQKHVIGALYVGRQAQDDGQLRQSHHEHDGRQDRLCLRFGSSGEHKGCYVISYKGERDGENIWDAQDNSGNHFIQNIINKAVANPPGKCDIVRYDWQNKGETPRPNKSLRLHLLSGERLGGRRGRLRGRFPRRRGANPQRDQFLGPLEHFRRNRRVSGRRGQFPWWSPRESPAPW